VSASNTPSARQAIARTEEESDRAGIPRANQTACLDDEWRQLLACDTNEHCMGQLVEPSSIKRLACVLFVFVNQILRIVAADLLERATVQVERGPPLLTVRTMTEVGEHHLLDTLRL
jgi:hypothetical protein